MTNPAIYRLKSTFRLLDVPADPIVKKKKFLYPGDDIASPFQPHIGFENALKIGTPKDIYETFNSVKETGKGALSRIAVSQYELLVERCKRGYFGFMSGNNLCQWIMEVRAAMILGGHTPTPRFDSHVIECFRFASPDRIHRVIQFTSDVLKGKSNGEEALILIGLMGVLRHQGYVEKCQELFEYLKVKKDTAFGVYLELCQLYAENGQAEMAEQVYREWIATKTEGNELDFLQCVMKGFAMAGDIQNSRKYFSKMIASASSRYAMLAYGNLIKCYSIRGLVGDANEAYKHMRRKGVPVSASIYESMILVYESSKDITAANSWFLKIGGTDGLKPSMGMYSALAKVQLKAGETMVAWKTAVKAVTAFKENRSHSSRVRLASGLAQALSDDLNGKHVDYLRDHIRLSHFPNSHRGELITKLMLAALNPSSDGQPRTSLCLLLYNEFFDEKGAASQCVIPESAHVLAIKANELACNIGGAQTIFSSTIDSLKDKELDAYNALLHAFASNKQVDKVNNLYGEMKQLKLLPTANTIEALVRVANEQEIESLLRTALSAGIIAHPKSHPNLYAAFRASGLKSIPTILGL